MRGYKCVFLSPMKISYNWLKSLLSDIPSPEKTAELLTGCGLEVENMEKSGTVKGNLEGVIVGEVITKTKHPDADKLSLTTVNIGSGTPLNIVCGASNVAEGQKVLVATVGSTIYPIQGEPLTLKKAKIRGAVSEGMICAEDELGLGHSHDGIMVLDPGAVPGTPAAKHLRLSSDFIFEIGLTPNRADAASHWGVARDLAALTGSTTLFPVLHPAEKGTGLEIKVTVEDAAACPRYSGITISGIKVGPSPESIKKQLEAIGVRSINTIVDITNYVLHELGQPLHAFDAQKIAGAGIRVKKLPAGTKFITLDGVERKLDSHDLMICDAEKGMCIAGVFGGQHSGVTEQTTSIFLESACFDPIHIRKSSKRHGLKTDASFRFERGTDPEITVRALWRAAELIVKNAGGKVSSALFDHYPKPLPPHKISFSTSRCAKLIGKDIGTSEIRKILNALEIRITKETGDTWELEVPSYRVDVRRECDVVEEILRIYGYNRIEDPRHLRMSVSTTSKPDKESLQEKIAVHLSASGFHEIFSNSITRPEYFQNDTVFKPEHSVRLLNPLSSELSVLRQSLLFSGLEAIVYNRNRKQHNLRFFEFGKVYARYKSESALSSFHEEDHLSLFITGTDHEESWYDKLRPVNIFILKNEVRQLMRRLCLPVSFHTLKDNGTLDYGLEIRVGKQKIGMLGKVSVNASRKTDLQEPVFYAQLQWSLIIQLLKATSGIVYHPAPLYPEVRRDLALILDKKVHYEELEKIAFETEKELLCSVQLFDVFEGEKIGKDRKSYALRFILQDEKATLTDKQVDNTMDRLMKAFKDKLSAEIRT